MNRAEQGSGMDERRALLWWLRWQADMGADEALLPRPVDRTAQPARSSTPSAPRAATATDPATMALSSRREAPAVSASSTVSSPAVATPSESAAASMPTPAQCRSLEEIHAALHARTDFPLRRMARHTVLHDGHPQARVLLVGEAPGREEDLRGKPFVGRAGQLLDAMLEAIGLSRAAADPARAVLITNVLFWRPPGNRKPTDAELGFCAPWVQRVIELTRPRVIVTLGGTPTQRLTGQPAGIMRLRGKWNRLQVPGLREPVPLLPMLHPAYLLRQPAQKRLAWRDLLTLRAFLDEPGAS